MRSPAALVLVVITALVSIALANAGAASATVLCKIGTDPVCPSTSIYPSGTTLSGSLATGTEATLTTSSGTFHCTNSTISGKTTASESSSLPGTISEFTFSGCKGFFLSCEATSLNLPYAMKVTYTKENEGSLVDSSGGSGEPRVQINCGGGLVKCTLGTSMNVGLVGGEPGEIVASEEEMTLIEGSSFCEHPKFSATYRLSQPEGGAAFVAKNAALSTKLCTVVPAGGETCKGAGYSGEVKGQLVAKKSATFEPATAKGPTGEVSCGQAELKGPFNEDGTPKGAPGGVLTFTFNGGGGGSCSSTLAGAKPTVKVELKNVPYNKSNIVWFQPEAPQAVLGFAGASGPTNLWMVVEVTPNVTCKYKRSLFSGDVINSEAVLFVHGNFFLDEENPKSTPAVCPLTEVLNAPLDFMQSTGAALYVAKD